VCGREVSGNNYARHLTTHDENAPPPKRPRRRNPQAPTTTKGIGRYLRALESGEGERVNLGALPEFPAVTSDPEVVERAIVALRARGDEGGPIARLKRQQRIIDLTHAVETLRATSNGNDPRAFFITHGAEWAMANGIGYHAFRSMGVPASVLREAGIARTPES
jgi:hypothetical protein